jgi:hypothetical protein
MPQRDRRQFWVGIHSGGLNWDAFTQMLPQFLFQQLFTHRHSYQIRLRAESNMFKPLVRCGKKLV